MANDFALTLPRLTVDLREGVAVAGNLPLPTLDCIIKSGLVFRMDPATQGQMPWPMTLAASFQGFTATVELPALQGGSITGTIPNLLRVAAQLPALTGSASGHMGGTFAVAGTLPVINAVNMARGSAFAPVLPALQGSATITANPAFAFALTLPTLRGAAVIGVAQGVLTVNALLPALRGLSGSTQADAELPALQGSCIIVAGTQAVRRAWVMNVANAAFTEFSNFEFRAFARAYDRHYGAGLDAKLVRFGGDKDLTAPIAWSFQTGISDLNSRALKGVLALYLDGVAEAGADFGVFTDTGTYWYSHQPHGTPNNHKTQRVSIGRSLRSVNIGYGMRSTKGSYIEIDSITPDYQISGRNL